MKDKKRCLIIAVIAWITVLLFFPCRMPFEGYPLDAVRVQVAFQRLCLLAGALLAVLPLPLHREWRWGRCSTAFGIAATTLFALSGFCASMPSQLQEISVLKRGLYILQPLLISFSSFACTECVLCLLMPGAREASAGRGDGSRRDDELRGWLEGFGLTAREL